LRARRRRNTFEYDYDEYAYASCFMLLSCTGRHIRSECAHTGTTWLALGSARLFGISFLCFDGFFLRFFLGGRLAFLLEIRFCIVVRVCIAIRAYTAPVGFTQTVCLLSSVTLLYTPFCIIAVQGSLCRSYTHALQAWWQTFYILV
jgi:hypothetical protein